MARRRVLVVAATELELGALGGAGGSGGAGSAIDEAGLEGVATLACGIGPVEAAASTARELALRPPGALLHVGVAGARTLPVGTAVAGSESVYADLAAAIPVVSRVEPDARLLAVLRAAAPELQVLPIGTSAGVGGAAGFEVEAMEGFAVLRAAQLAGVPAVEVRVVANEIDESDRARWRIPEALERLGGLLPRLVDAVSRA